MTSFALAAVLTLTNLCGSVSVDTFGARVVSYRPAGGEEVLARLADGSGGIALCWPWFANDGPEGCRRHGVARYRDFAVASRTDSPRASELRLRLRSDEAARREFPHDFALTLVVRLEDRLTLRLIGENTGREPFAVTEMIHPYFRVGDARRCVVRGLDGLHYRDNMHPELGDTRVWRGDYAVGEGSKVFAFGNPAAVHVLELDDPVLGRTLSFTSSNDLKAVVWSPGEATANGKNVTSKLAPGEWKAFVCVENGTCYGDRAYVLRPGERHELVRTIGCLGAAQPGAGTHPRSDVYSYDGTLRDGCWLYGHDSGDHDGLGNNPMNFYNVPMSPNLSVAEAARGFGLRNVCVCRWVPVRTENPKPGRV